MRVSVVVGSLALIGLPAPARAESPWVLELSLPQLEGLWRPTLAPGLELRLPLEFAWGGQWVETPASLSPRGSDPAQDWSYSRVWFEDGTRELRTFSRALPVLAIGGDGRFGSEFSSGVEGRVHLGSIGPIQRAALLGRVESVTPSLGTRDPSRDKRRPSVRALFGLGGLF